MRRCFWLIVLLLPIACAPDADPTADASDAPAYASAAALIEAMHERYQGQWYETLTFVQETIQYDQEGQADTSTWYEAYAAPGRLRIDIAPLVDGNGLLFADDRRYTIRDGAVADARPQIHPLLILGFDVYHQPPAVTLAKLDTLGFDLSKMFATTWQGRPAVVVGAADAGEEASQFWIDAERLYFTRMIRYVGPGGQSVQEVQFNRYEPLGGGWIAPEVLFDFDGRRVLEETYSEMRPGVALDSALFDPERWRATHWRVPQ